MSDSIVLGIDVGTTNLKVLAFDVEGRIVARASASYPVASGKDGQVTQDPGEWVCALDDCFHSLRSRCQLGSVRALAISAQGETLVCCDAQGTPLDQAISWMDTRAAKEAQELQAERQDWTSITGKPVAAYSTLAKIHWMRKHRPDLSEKTARFCQVGDYMIAFLTGEWLLDANNASFTSFFDVRKRDWSSSITGQFELADKLPSVAESGTVAGGLRVDLSQRWGLSRNVSVVLGGHDQGCAAVGAGLREGTALLSTGTAWVLYASTSQPMFDVGSRIVTYCHTRPERWACLAAFSGGGALDAYATNFIWQGKSSGFYAAIENGADLQSEVIVLPYFYGANAPSNRPSARAAIFNLGPLHRPEHVGYAILEAIAFETRRNLSTFAEMHLDCERLIMTGGAARSPVWPQIVADACGIPVHLSSELDSAAVGSALLAGESVGLWRNGFSVKAAEKIIQPSEAKERLELKFQRYIEALHAAGIRANPRES